MLMRNLAQMQMNGSNYTAPRWPEGETADAGFLSFYANAVLSCAHSLLLVGF